MTIYKNIKELESVGKLSANSLVNAEGYEEYEGYNEPYAIVKVCRCEQCRGVRDKRKNRILKKRIKRLYNKKRRNWKHNGKIIYHYWA